MSENCCPDYPSCCEKGGPSEKRVVVDYLYLDLKTCDRCIGTGDILDEVMKELTPVLELAGYEVEYNKTEMATAEIAERNKFLSSPTIRVNGTDICQSVAETECGCCGEIARVDVDCRVFEYNGQFYEVPPKEMLAEAIMKAVFGNQPACSCVDYVLPENLKNFFEGKRGKSSCACEGQCC